jgi:hypothetical protein
MMASISAACDRPRRLVDHDLVVVALARELDRAFRCRISSSSAVSVARERSRWNSASSDGGTMNTSSASGPAP